MTLDLSGSNLVALETATLQIVRPQPRWATKWAWFWLIGVGPMAAVFLLLAPVPVWRGEPAYARPSLLTGGWALLLAIVAGAILAVVARLVFHPWLAAMSSTWGGVAPGGWFAPRLAPAAL